MSKYFKKHFIFIMIIAILFSLSGCKNNKNKSTSLEEKVNTEISYIDSELVSIINSLNNIDYAKYKVVEQNSASQSNSSEGSESGSSSKQSSEDKNSQESGGSSEESSGEGEKGSGSESSGKSSSKSESSTTQNKTFAMQANSVLNNQSSQINWNQLKNKIESLYTTWMTVCTDLKELNVSDEDLIKFGKNIDLAAVAIKNENKEDVINAVTELYSFLPKFLEVYSKDDKAKNVLKTKYSLLQCYRYADLEKWDELQNALTDLKMSFSNISSKKEEYKGKMVNINNAAIIVNEMGNSISLKDKDIFFIKYKSLMQELNVI